MRRFECWGDGVENCVERGRAVGVEHVLWVGKWTLSGSVDELSAGGSIEPLEVGLFVIKLIGGRRGALEGGVLNSTLSID